MIKIWENIDILLGGDGGVFVQFALCVYVV